jgi:cellulose 1,4-beta-cellobiosidase
MVQQFNPPCGRASVRRLSGYLAVFAALLLTVVAPGAFAQTHVANPYVGASVYVSPDYAAEVATAQAAEPSLAGQMATVAKQPTFVWLDRIAAIAGGSVNSNRLGLQGHINAAVAQANGAEIVVQLVIYDLPDRDCAALASNGELSIAGGDIPKGYTTALTGTGIQEYENDYITPIYNILAAAPSNVRFVLVIEDDSLPNILTNTGVSFTDANCVAANGGVSNAGLAANWTQLATPVENIPTTGVYYQGISYAVNSFHKLPNVYNYLDIGHHGWLGWTSNTAYAVQFFSGFAQQLTAGYASIDGFITNTANYGPLTEPYIVWDEVAGGPETSTSLSSGIFTGDFYQWDPAIDELSYKTFFLQALTASTTAGYTDPRGQAHTPGGGFPSTVGFLIDTSRNGWGNTSAANGGGSSAYTTRPTAAGTSTVIDTFVNESKIDLRNSSGQWCNQENAGIGELPVANPTTGVSAYVWVKPPGEADGNYPGSVYNGVTSTVGDPNCNPVTANPQAGADTIANSIPNPPPAGTFWLTEFVQLVQDAYPVLASSSTSGFTLTPASATETIAQSASATDAITVTDTGGFTGTVTLTATSSNTGVTVTVSGTTLTIKASSTATGTATITVTGTSGTTTATTSIAVTITTAGSFTIKPSAATLSIAQGATGTDTITVTDVSPFTGSVTLTNSTLPTGVTVAYGTNPTTSTSVLTFTVAATATAATSTITITGTSGSLTATTTIALTVTTKAGFTLTPAASSETLNQSGSVTDAITVTDTGGFTGTVTLTAASSNTGVTVTVSGTTLTIKASATATGTATITVTGTSGTTTATTTIAVTITAPGFTLAPSASTLSVTQAKTATDTITVTDKGGFTGSVTLTTSTLPSGVTVAYGTNPTTSTSVLTFTASATATTGAFTVTITGTSGTLTATTTITLTVVPSTSGSCTVDYVISPQNTSAFGASITIINGSTAVTSWTLSWTFANGQTVAQLWNGIETQSGAVVTVKNEPYNGSIAAGGTLSGIGFNGTWNGTTNAVPTAISLNGTACTVN